MTRFLIALILTALPMMALGQAIPTVWHSEFPRADFSNTLIDLSEIQSGGPPRDGIPALSDPHMIDSAGETRLSPREPVLVLALPGTQARAYPLRYLTWHEIVNDVVDGLPVAVTYCPLCNTGMVFDRRHEGRTLSFGVSGLLRFSDMIMFDRETESWWQQALGQAVVGHLAGAQLRQLPAWMSGWDEYRAEFPQGLVMDEPRSSRPYGSNPYVGYDVSSRPFLYRGENPPHDIHPLARVIRVENRAWPLERVRSQGVVTEVGVTLTWVEGQASALEASEIGAGREVGSVRVIDESGADIVHDMPFAFAFHAFHPDGEWMIE